VDVVTAIPVSETAVAITPKKPGFSSIAFLDESCRLRAIAE
jgi:hypothetical protein